MTKGAIVTRDEDFPRWYQEVIARAEMADNGPVRGTMVIRPWGYGIWELLQAELDRRIKEAGAENAYFPLFIPESFLSLEAEHVEGFSPELAVVTHGGGKKLEEPVVVRPTSETVINSFFAKWIQSYRDLPLLINQWANVVRWELRPRLFLRTTEFLWQEGHTAHATHEEALEEVLRILDIYAEVAEDVMAMPVIKGAKTRAEKFAGALRSYSIEAMMQNGLALQAGTSHDLGQNFGKAFDVQFQSKEGQLDYVWQTSWGVSTRLIGGLIMSHSDDKGLVLPPKLAPIKAVLVPIYRKDEEKDRVLDAAHRIAQEIGAKVDGREGQSPGAKFFHWERRGVPLVLELGPRDVASGNIVLKRRDTGVKEVVAQTEIGARVNAALEAMQKDLYRAAQERLRANTMTADSIGEVEEILREVTAEKGGGKFVMAHVKDDPACDARLKEFKATVRNIPLVDEYDGAGRCVITGEAVERRVVIAKSY